MPEWQPVKRNSSYGPAVAGAARLLDQGRNTLGSHGRFGELRSTRRVDFARFERIPSLADALRYRFASAFSETYRQRLAWSHCDPDVGQALRRAASSRDGRLMFIKNPKAACSSGAQLVHLHDHGAYCSTGNIHDSTAIRQGLSHAIQHTAVLADPEAIRFTFIRNPLDRAVSAFLMFFVGSRVSGKALDRERGMRTLGFDPTQGAARNFDVFLEYLAHSFETDPAHCNPHWREQVRNIAHRAIDYQVIGRVEALDDAINEIAQRLERPFISLDGPIMPRFNRRPSDGQDQLVISDLQRRKIRDLYAADYEAFGY